MRIVLLFTALMLGLNAIAVDVTWDFQYFTGQANSNRPVDIQPIRWGALTPTLFTQDRIKYTNNATGILTVSNMTTNVAYSVTFWGKFSTLVFTNQFPPGTTGAVYASDYLTATNVVGPQTAYSVAQANNKFALKTNSLFYGAEPKINGTNFSSIYGGGSTYTNYPGLNAGTVSNAVAGIGTNAGPFIAAATNSSLAAMRASDLITSNAVLAEAHNSDTVSSNGVIATIQNLNYIPQSTFLATNLNVINQIRDTSNVLAAAATPPTNDLRAGLYSFYGDSLTGNSGAGVGGTAFPSQFSNTLSLTITNAGVGGTGWSEIYSNQWLIDSNNWATGFKVFWGGNNDGITGSNNIYLYTRTVISNLTAAGNSNYLFLGIIENTNIAASFLPTYTNINNQIKLIAGTNHFLDIHATLLASTNSADPLDAVWVTNGWTPHSLLADQIHLNTTGYGVVSTNVIQKDVFNWEKPASRREVLKVIPGLNYDVVRGYGMFSIEGQTNQIGYGALGYRGSFAAGLNTIATNGVNMLVIGTSSVGTNKGVALTKGTVLYGINSFAGNSAVVIGDNSSAVSVNTNDSAFILGNFAFVDATAAPNGPTGQLGPGSNTVGGTLQFRSFPLFDATGFLYQARVPSVVLTNSYAGTITATTFSGSGSGLTAVPQATNALQLGGNPVANFLTNNSSGVTLAAANLTSGPSLSGPIITSVISSTNLSDLLGLEANTNAPVIQNATLNGVLSNNAATTNFSAFAVTNEIQSMAAQMKFRPGSGQGRVSVGQWTTDNGVGYIKLNSSTPNSTNYSLRPDSAGGDSLLVNGNSLGLQLQFNARTVEVVTNDAIYNLAGGYYWASGGGVTNMWVTNATLDFPSTAAGTVSFLTINLTNVSDGDFVTLAPPAANYGSITGLYSAWATNGYVIVQFASTTLVTSQDPPSGNFRVKVEKVK